MYSFSFTNIMLWHVWVCMSLQKALCMSGLMWRRQDDNVEHEQSWPCKPQWAQLASRCMFWHICCMFACIYDWGRFLRPSCCITPHVFCCRAAHRLSAFPPSPRGDASSAASRLVRADSRQITDVLHRGNCLPNPLHWCKFKGSPVMEIMPNWFGDFEMSTQHG